MDRELHRKVTTDMRTANWENRTLFHGDNLKFLRTMNSESIDLIANGPTVQQR